MQCKILIFSPVGCTACTSARPRELPKKKHKKMFCPATCCKERLSEKHHQTNETAWGVGLKNMPWGKRIQLSWLPKAPPGGRDSSRAARKGFRDPLLQHPEGPTTRVQQKGRRGLGWTPPPEKCEEGVRGGHPPLNSGTVWVCVKKAFAPHFQTVRTMLTFS